MSDLSLFFLGPPKIEKDGIQVQLSRRKAIALLAYLAVSGGSHSRDALVGLLWPDYDQSRTRAFLRRDISALKIALGEGWFDIEREKIGLQKSEGLWLDVDQFQSCLSECKSHGHGTAETCAGCAKLLTEAVGLYEDDFLAGFSLQDSVNFDDWHFFQTQELRTKFFSALERLVVYHSSNGELEKAIDHVHRWLGQDRTDEKAHRYLMEFHAKQGQRAAALRQYEECVKILEKELGEKPQEATVQLYHSIKGNTFSIEGEIEAELSSDNSADTPINNLPRQLTSFIGRKKEVEEVKGLLCDTYLLTLTGVGGCGKTRLALEVASGLVGEYRDGVWLVELAGLSNPDYIPQEIASTLGVREQGERRLLDTVSDYLRSKDILLILDNCEHLIEACAELAEVLLRICPELKIMATSREALGIGGEAAWRVPSLSMPDSVGVGFESAQTIELSDLTKYEAMNLFIDRAENALSGFTMTEDNASAVGQICHRLDGIPLAIELAAARVKVLSVEEITARLDDRFRLLTGGSRTALPRQQTLRSTIDWSYNLLSEEERTLLDRLSVFRGGWTLAAAEAICTGGGIEKFDVLDLLTSLVDKSLVVTEKEASPLEEGSGETRYNLLETVRQYGGERLMQSGEGAELHDRHLKWFQDLAERAKPEFIKPDQLKWLARIGSEFDNLMAALEWSKDGEESEAELILALALSDFLGVRGLLSGNRLLEDAVSRSSKAPPSLRAKVLSAAGYKAWQRGDDSKAFDLAEEALRVYRELEDKNGIADARLVIGAVLWHRGEFDRALEEAEEVLAIRRELGDKRGIALILLGMTQITRGRGDYDRALELAEKSLSMFQEIGEKWMIAFALHEVSSVARQMGDHHRALESSEEALALFREFGNKGGIGSSLNILGRVAQDQGDYERAASLHKEALPLWNEVGHSQIVSGLEDLAKVAIGLGDSGRGARLFGASEALRQSNSHPLPPAYHEEYDRSLASGRADLGEDAFEAALEEGRKMSMEEAVDYALKIDDGELSQR